LPYKELVHVNICDEFDGPQRVDDANKQARVSKDCLTLKALQVDDENLNHAHGQHQREDHRLYDCDSVGLSFEYLWVRRVQGEPDVRHLKGKVVQGQPDQGLCENAQHIEWARPKLILLLCLQAVPEHSQGSHNQVQYQCKFASEIHLEAQAHEQCGFHYDYYGEGGYVQSE